MELFSCIQDELFLYFLEFELGVLVQFGFGKLGDKWFWLWYVGGLCLDCRIMLFMLFWFMVEICRCSQKFEVGGCGVLVVCEVILVFSVFFLCCVFVLGVGVLGGISLLVVYFSLVVFIFEYKVQYILCFIYNSYDFIYFVYLIKVQFDDFELQMVCYVFCVIDFNQVFDVISSIR